MKIYWSQIFFFVLLFVLEHNNFILAQTTQQADAPKFSIKRGFYSTPFELSISSPHPNAVIKFTLDGAEPKTALYVMTQNSPAIISVNPESNAGQRPKAPCFVVRAYVSAPGMEDSKSVTHTYIFVDYATSLSTDGIKPGYNWPSPSNSANPQMINYGLDPNVFLDSRYKDSIDDALLSIPSISLVTDLDNLFSLTKGIYMNAMMDGMDWERPASIELLNPDGSDGFQINAGLRIRGGWSRHGDDPKHAFRLFFRAEYGEANLHHPLFGKEGVDEFDKVDLRTSQNYAWSYPGHMGEYNIMVRDVFSRDLQRETGQQYTRSRFYHLYINGVYWGIYQTQERAEASFAESYFGGYSTNYDVIKVGDNYVVDATDGNLDAYKEIWNYCLSGFKTNTNYLKLSSLNADGTRNPASKVLVDVDNLIDYMMVIFYSGNYDAPTSKFGSNKGANNFYAIYNHNGKEGFKFFVHDAEHTIRTTSGEGPGIGLNENRVNIGTLTDGNKMTVSSISNFHPQWLHFKLTDNLEYRVKFADHVYKHFFNEGCMTPAKVTSLFQTRTKEIETAIIAESARWGDTYREPPRNKNDDWLPAVNDIIKNYFPYRTDIVLAQLKQASLYPDINPPIYNINQKVITSNIFESKSEIALNVFNPNNITGTIYYTLDGTDPRLFGGSISSSAKDGGDQYQINLSNTTVIKSRILNGTTWSAIHEITVFINNPIQNLKLTEIHYHPLKELEISDDEFEFIELKNIGSAPINLTGCNFVNGITYTFPQGAILEPNKFLVLASNKIEFNKRYSFIPYDEYFGQLDNGGEKISLVSASGDTVFSIRYNDKAPWPTLPDSDGYSLVPNEISPIGDMNDPANWRASINVHGSPGTDDLATSIETSAALPTNVELFTNYPNPFNPETVISYQLPLQSNVTLKIFDLLGREVKTLINEKQRAGKFQIRFNAANLSSGIYFYQLHANEQTVTKKMILLR